MKYCALFFACALLGLGLASCGQTQSPAEETSSPSHLHQRWTLVMMTGGFAGDTTFPPQGIVRDVEFTADGRSSRYDNAELQHSSSYTTAVEQSMLTGDSVLMITYESGWKESVRLLTEDSLVLSDEAADGSHRHYTAGR